MRVSASKLSVGLGLVAVVAGGFFWIHGEFRELHRCLDRMEAKVANQKSETVAPNEKPILDSGATTVAAPDILRLRFSPQSPELPKDGEFLIRPNGKISFGAVGEVFVAGMTLSQVESAIQQRLANAGHKTQVVVEVATANSKTYSLVEESPEGGEQLSIFPMTGNETVLDAMAKIGGPAIGTKSKIWIARSATGSEADQILPVDWVGITAKGHVRTNYQILPGDRVYVKNRE